MAEADAASPSSGSADINGVPKCPIMETGAAEASTSAMSDVSDVSDSDSTNSTTTPRSETSSETSSNRTSSDSGSNSEVNSDQHHFHTVPSMDGFGEEILIPSDDIPDDRLREGSPNNINSETGSGSSSAGSDTHRNRNTGGSPGGYPGGGVDVGLPGGGTSVDENGGNANGNGNGNGGKANGNGFSRSRTREDEYLFKGDTPSVVKRAEEGIRQPLTFIPKPDHPDAQRDKSKKNQSTSGDDSSSSNTSSSTSTSTFTTTLKTILPESVSTPLCDAINKIKGYVPHVQTKAPSQGGGLGNWHYTKNNKYQDAHKYDAEHTSIHTEKTEILKDGGEEKRKGIERDQIATRGEGDDESCPNPAVAQGGGMGGGIGGFNFPQISTPAGLPDVSHESEPARYAVFAARITKLLSRGQRYLAFSSDVGEAARPVVPKKIVNFSYGVTGAYICGDVAWTGWKEMRVKSPTPVVYDSVSRAAVFQFAASLAIPFLVIHGAVAGTQKHLVPRMFGETWKRSRQWFPTFVGLGCIPLLPTAVDEPCEHAVNFVFDRWNPFELKKGQARPVGGEGNGGGNGGGGGGNGGDDGEGPS